MKARTVPAGEFKAKCLALLDEVAKTGETLVVTKRGKPVARILPPENDEDTRAWLKRSITTPSACSNRERARSSPILP